MSHVDRLQTTPAAIHDALETQIPFQYRAQVNYLFWQLKQDAPVHLDDAMVRGHAVASQLKAIADSQTTPRLYTDAEPSACRRVADHLYAAMDAARQRNPSPYPGGTVNDVTSVSDRDAAYRIMVAHNANAWRTQVARHQLPKPTVASLPNSPTPPPSTRR